MKCSISLKHAEGEHGEWTKASDLPEYKLAQNQNTGNPAMRIGDRMFFFSPTTSVAKTPITTSCKDLYRLLPKGAVVVLIQ